MSLGGFFVSQSDERECGKGLSLYYSILFLFAYAVEGIYREGE